MKGNKRVFTKKYNTTAEEFMVVSQYEKIPLTTVYDLLVILLLLDFIINKIYTTLLKWLIDIRMSFNHIRNIHLYIYTE